MYNALMYILRNAVTLPASTVFPGPAGTETSAKRSFRSTVFHNKVDCFARVPHRREQASSALSLVPFVVAARLALAALLLHPHASVLVGAFTC